MCPPKKPFFRQNCGRKIKGGPKKNEKSSTILVQNFKFKNKRARVYCLLDLAMTFMGATDLNFPRAL